MSFDLTQHDRDRVSFTFTFRFRGYTTWYVITMAPSWPRDIRFTVKFVRIKTTATSYKVQTSTAFGWYKSVSVTSNIVCSWPEIMVTVLQQPLQFVEDYAQWYIRTLITLWNNNKIKLISHHQYIKISSSSASVCD